jgi:hypothetical protein
MLPASVDSIDAAKAMFKDVLKNIKVTVRP